MTATTGCPVRGDRTEAIEILRERSTSAEALGQPFRWSSWRRVLARWEMREGPGAKRLRSGGKPLS